MKSQHYFCHQENMENEGLSGKDLGISNSSLAARDCADLSDRGILTPRNRDSARSKERETPNSSTHFGSFSYQGHSKHQGSGADLMGIGCRCNLDSTCRTNSSSNHSRSRSFHGLDNGLKLNTVTSEQRFGPINRSEFEVNSRPLARVASEGDLNEMKYELEFGSTLQRRSISPKVQTLISPEMVSNSSEIKRYRRICDMISDNMETQTYQSPNYGLHFFPNENPSSNKPKQWYTRRSDYLLHKHQCSCSKHKSQKREACCSDNLEAKFIRKSFCNESQRKVDCSSTKGKSSLSLICKVSTFLVFLVIVFLYVPMKETLLRPNFLALNSYLGINQTDLVFNPIDLEGNHSRDANSERQSEPHTEGSGSRGELDEIIKPFASNEAVLTEEVEKLSKHNFREIPAEENTSKEENIENIKSLASNEIVLIEAEMLEEPNFTEAPTEENTSTEEFQSRSQEEFKSENVKQCRMLDVSVDGLEGLVDVPVKEIGHVVLVEADTVNRVEERKLEMRIKLCLVFLSVIVCASLVSCIVRREQFSEMLQRYSSLNKGGKSSKKKPTDSNIPVESSYGSIVTYEKIPIKKRGRDTAKLLTPVRRSSRIRNYLASPS